MKIANSDLMEKFLVKIVKQWIAGDTVDDALNSARLANKHGMESILNKLGEHVTSKPK